MKPEEGKERKEETVEIKDEPGNSTHPAPGADKVSAHATQVQQIKEEKDVEKEKEEDESDDAKLDESKEVDEEKRDWKYDTEKAVWDISGEELSGEENESNIEKCLK